MNRKHTADGYFKLIDRIREARPDIAMSGDFIVGFPGETEEDFQDTLDLVERVTYAQAFSFKYSARPGTPLPVLLEKPGRKDGQLVGKSPYLQAVHVDGGPDLIGTIQQAEIVSSGTNSLMAALIV